MKNGGKFLLLVIFLIFSESVLASNTNAQDELVNIKSECDNSVYLCTSCTYTYNGTYKDSLSREQIVFNVIADGTGGGKLITHAMEATKNINFRSSLYVKTKLSFGDFFKDDKNGFQCPKIAYNLSWEAEEGDEDRGDYVLEFFLPNSNTKDGNILNPVEYTNGKKFRNSKIESTTKNCYFLNEAGTYSLSVRYDAATKKATFISDDSINKWGLESSDEAIFGKHKCNEILLYYKRNKLKDTEDDYVLSLSEKSVKGYEKLYGVDETTDFSKLKERLEQSVNKNKYRSTYDTSDDSPLTGVLTCNGLLGGENSELRKLLTNILKFIRYGGPILMLLLTIVDLVKTVTSGDDKDFKKVFQNFIKRFIAAALLFFINDIIGLIFLIVGLDYECVIDIK